MLVSNGPGIGSPSFGPHTPRRANATSRSAACASDAFKIVGHGDVDMPGEYQIRAARTSGSVDPRPGTPRGSSGTATAAALQAPLPRESQLNFRPGDVSARLSARSIRDAPVAAEHFKLCSHIRTTLQPIRRSRAGMRRSRS